MIIYKIRKEFDLIAPFKDFLMRASKKEIIDNLHNFLYNIKCKQCKISTKEFLEVEIIWTEKF